MADNYLERKMEEHERPASRRCNADARLAAAFGCEALCRLRVFVASGDYAAVSAAVRVLRGAGCRTAFMAAGDARQRGATLAQRCGARCYPCVCADARAYSRTVADLLYHWGGVDVVVADSVAELPADLAGCTRITPSEASAYLDALRRR